MSKPKTTKLDVASLSSEQISQVLDKLLFLMMEPVVLYTDYGFELAASLLSLLQNNRRRVCGGDRQVAVTQLFTALCLRDRELLLKALIENKFERNLLLYYVGLTIECNGADSEWNSSVVYPPDLAVEYGPLKTHLVYVHGLYNTFREMIIERYNPIIKSQASRIMYRKELTGITVSKKDALQNCLLAAIKALDKFHASQGTLTTYLIKWVSSSISSSFSMGIGESFTITRNARTRIAKGSLALNNMSVDIEASYEIADLSENGEEALTRDEYMNRLAAFISNTPLMDKYPDALSACGVKVKRKTT